MSKLQHKSKRVSRITKRYWLTPPNILRDLMERYPIDFDPCPNPLPGGFDGLVLPWGNCSYVNPPFRGGLVNWAKKALRELALGKTILFVCPTFQPRTIALLGPVAKKIEYFGRIRWLSIEEGDPLPGPESELTSCFLFILQPESSLPV